jgi:hypothetical protein
MLKLTAVAPMIGGGRSSLMPHSAAKLPLVCADTASDTVSKPLLGNKGRFHAIAGMQLL